jgi:hypothetical protein
MSARTAAGVEVGEGPSEVQALRGVDLSVEAGGWSR